MNRYSRLRFATNSPVLTLDKSLHFCWQSSCFVKEANINLPPNNLTTLSEYLQNTLKSLMENVMEIHASASQRGYLQ